MLADGFYEWRDEGGKEYPYYIRLKSREAFAFAGIWDSWTSPATGETGRTFSILTTRANPLMERVHNTRKRMPSILRREDKPAWLTPGLDDSAIMSLLQPYDETLMEAYTVSRLVSTTGVKRNVPEAIAPVRYEELGE